jgi:thiol-disulfide isomerase/thioredoxin
MRKRDIIAGLVVFFMVTAIITVGGFKGSQPVYADLQSAPKVKLNDIEGNSCKLSDFKGKVVILNFWAVWCPPCKLEIPSLVDLYATYGEKGLMVFGIALDSGEDEAIREKSKEFGITYPVINGDYHLRKAFGGIRAVPTTVLIDQEGEIYKTYLGYREKQVIEEDLQNLLGSPETVSQKNES